MKLFRLLLFISLFLYLPEAKCQDKWRSLTLSSVSGADFRGNYFNTVSSNLHWDFSSKTFFTNWTGMQVQHGYTKNFWVTSQSTVNRRYGNWVVGAGLQYGVASNPGVLQINNRMGFAVTSVSYRWKFGSR